MTFQVKGSIPKNQQKRKRKLQQEEAKARRRVKRQLERAVKGPSRDKPMFCQGPVRFETSERSQACGYGGLAAIHQMVGKLDKPLPPPVAGRASACRSASVSPHHGARRIASQFTRSARCASARVSASKSWIG